MKNCLRRCRKGKTRVQSELFEWDNEKAATNLRIHNVDFREAVSVFHDIYAITGPDELHSEHEARSITLGLSDRARVLLVVHTERMDRIRIISARKATSAERREYEREFGA